MSLSMIEQLADATDIQTFFDSVKFNRVETVSNVGDMSYQDHTLMGTHYSTLKVMFPSLHDSLSFFLSAFTQSEIKSIESMIRFYIRLFPYDALETAINKNHPVITVNHRSDACWVNFEAFTIVRSYKKWKFKINDKHDKSLDLDALNFQNIQIVLLHAFYDMFHNIFKHEQFIINNELALKVAKNQDNFSFTQMRYQHMFTHETDMDFAKHVRDYGNLHIVTDDNVKNRVIHRGVMGVSGNRRVVKNILHVAKQSETHISIHNECVDLLDNLFHIALTPTQLDYLKKTLEVMRLADICYPKHKDNEIQIIRANNGKKTIFNLISERTPYQFKTGRHCLIISSFISVGFYIENEYCSERVKTFQEAYELCYNLLIKHVGKSLDIDPKDVTELHFKTLEMSNY